MLTFCYNTVFALRHTALLSAAADRCCCCCLQANSEVSALLGRIPSAVGYQPTLATDLGGLQERITTTTKGSITSVQVRYSVGVCVITLMW